MKKLLLLWILLPVMACTEKKPSQPSMCNCKLDEKTIENLVYPLSAHNDSIIFCRGFTMVTRADEPFKHMPMHWVDIFSEHTVDDSTPFYNCIASEKIKLKTGEYSARYANKRLHIESYMTLSVYGPTQVHPHNGLFKVYKEEIYAENGSIKKTDAVVLELPVFTPKQVELVHERFEKQQADPKTATREMAGALLVAAISGDNLSRERLLKYSADFPGNDHSKFVEQAVTLLHDYEKSKKGLAKENTGN